MKISSELMILFLTVSISPIIIISVIDYIDFSDSLESEIFDELNRIGDLEEKRLVDEINHSFELMDLVKSRTALRENLGIFMTTQNINSQERMNKILKDAALSISDIHELSIVTKNGMVIASSNLDKINSEATMFHDDLSMGKFQKKHFDFIIKNELVFSHINDKIQFNENDFAIISMVLSSRNIISESQHKVFGNSGEFLIGQKNIDGDGVFVNNIRFQDNPNALKIIPKTRTDIVMTQALSSIEEDL